MPSSSTAIHRWPVSFCQIQRSLTWLNLDNNGFQLWWNTSDPQEKTCACPYSWPGAGVTSPFSWIMWAFQLRLKILHRHIYEAFRIHFKSWSSPQRGIIILWHSEPLNEINDFLWFLCCCNVHSNDSSTWGYIITRDASAVGLSHFGSYKNCLMWVTGLILDDYFRGKDVNPLNCSGSNRSFSLISQKVFCIVFAFAVLPILYMYCEPHLTEDQLQLLKSTCSQLSSPESGQWCRCGFLKMQIMK